MKVNTHTYGKAEKEYIAREYEKIAQFWMTYMIAVNGLHRLDYAINTNIFELRLRLGKR